MTGSPDPDPLSDAPQDPSDAGRASNEPLPPDHRDSTSARAEMDRAKVALRKSIAAKGRAMDSEQAAEDSRSICQLILREAWWPCSGVLMVYAPISNEPDVAGVIRAGISAGVAVAVPRIDWATGRLEPARIADLEKDLTPSRHGIREPGDRCPAVDLRHIDAVLVPGVAFGERGERLGRGGGFYDRFFARGELRARRVGVAFDFQVVPEVPVGRHDARMDVVVTPSRVIRATGRE